MKILSNWIPLDDSFAEHKLGTSTVLDTARGCYPGTNATFIRYKTQFTWVNNLNINLNPYSGILRGLLVGSCWPRNNMMLNPAVEYIGYIDLDARSQEFVILAEVHGDIGSCEVKIVPNGSSSPVILLEWYEDEHPSYVFDVESRTIDRMVQYEP